MHRILPTSVCKYRKIIIIRLVSFCGKNASYKYISSIQKAADLNINPLAYRKLAQQQIHYVLGDTGRSFVVGFGVNPPVRAHHESRFEGNVLLIEI